MISTWTSPSLKGDSLIRYPAVAGTFYPSSPSALSDTLQNLLSSAEGKERNIVGAIVPHAGYMYSGPVAAHVYASLHDFSRVVVVGPNHTGFGPGVSVFPRGEWVTPLGSVPVDAELAAHIVDHSERATPDVEAHMFEHSVEVQLPFLQVKNPSFSFAPVVMLDQSIDAAEDLARAVPDDVLFLASSDFSHYVPESVAREVDSLLLQSILSLDYRTFYRLVEELNASVCGYGPITALVAWAKKKGARAELLRYATSGDVTGDTTSVVGYAAVVFYV